MDPRIEQRLEQLRAKAEPDVRRFVDWAATELHRAVTIEVGLLGVPPGVAGDIAARLVRQLAVNGLSSVKRYHAMKDQPFAGKAPWL